MPELLEKALQKIAALSPEEQEVVARRILAELEDDDVWKEHFTAKGDILTRMAGEALEEDERGETLPLDAIL